MNLRYLQNLWIRCCSFSRLSGINHQELAREVVEKAVSFGASAAGIAGIAVLRNSPSCKRSGGIVWPAGVKSVLVLALAHRAAEPELDWWGGKGGTPGNHKLQTISKDLVRCLRDTFGIRAEAIPYQPADQGIFLKDAAVLAGLGTIGANNLLVTPQFGPRVRLRALFLDAALSPTGPVKFSPCDGCLKNCIKACPRQAFQDGPYDSARCRKQMREDEAKQNIAANPSKPPAVCIKYCRACELSCPVGTCL